MPTTGARRGLSFPRFLHLRRSSDFRRVQGRGHKIRRPSLLVLWLPRVDAPTSRVGLTVSKKVGNAVARNRVKRWLREAIRHELHRLDKPADVVFIAHPSAANAGLDALRSEVRSVLRAVVEGPPARSGRRRRGRPSRRSRGGGGGHRGGGDKGASCKPPTP